MTPVLLIFFILAGLSVLGALSLVLQKHPIHSALSLIVVMVCLAGLYLLMGAEFVAAVQIIVYGGAIMVLFIFVIMLLNAGAETRSKGSRVAVLFGIPGMLVGSLFVAWVLLQSHTPSVAAGALPGAPRTIGWLLFHDYLLPFEVTSVLVLIAIMGAVVLAARPESVQHSKREG